MESRKVPKFSSEEAERFYDLLRHEGETEIRVLSDKGAQSFFAETRKKFLGIVDREHGKGDIYVGLHERIPGGTRSGDVVVVRFLPFDIDIRRKKGQGATEEQLKKAFALAQEIKSYMINQDYERPTILMSGNGYWLLFPMETIRLTSRNRKEVEKKFKGFGRSIIKRFRTGAEELGCTLDENVYDLARCVRVPGTLNMKAKPYRQVKIVEYHNKPSKKLKEDILNFHIEPLECILKNSTSLSQLEEELKPYPCIQGILRDPDPSHEQRLNLALILKNLKKISRDQALDFILKNAKWGDLKKEVTEKQLKDIWSREDYNTPPKKKRLEPYCLNNCKSCIYIEELRAEIPRPIKELTLFDLERIIKENKFSWRNVRACIAVMATHFLKDVEQPVALFLTGSPSGQKGTILKLFYGLDRTLVYRSDDFTPTAFVSHYAGAKKEELDRIDLLPKIVGKTFLTPELAPLFNKREETLHEYLGLITRVMDGEGLQRDSGAKGYRGYSGDYYFTWLGATVPPTPKAWRAMGKLGSRLLFLNTDLTERPEPDKIVTELVDTITREKPYKERVEICREAITNYILTLYNKYKEKKVVWGYNKEDKRILRTIAKLSKLLVHLRAQINVYSILDEDGKPIYEYSGKIQENPIRLFTQLNAIARGHALIHERKHLNHADLKLILDIALSTMPEERRKVTRKLLERGYMTTEDVEEAAEVSKATASKIMRTFEALGVCILDTEESSERGHPTNTITLIPEFQKWFIQNKEFQELLGGGILL